MRNRRERLAKLVVAAFWLGGLILALRLGIGAVDPSQVLGLLVAIYLGMWGLVFFLRPNATTTNAARFVLVTMGIGLAIGLVEVPSLTGRIDYRDLFQTPTAAWRRHNHRPDPDLIYVREGNRRERRKFIGGELAGLSETGTRVVYESDVWYDAEGFRNPAVEKTADIVVVGDSFVEGLHVSDAELITAQLAKETSRSVVNLGRSGDGPQQERFVLERFGLPKRPKVCIWMFYEGNDLEDAADYETLRAAVSNLGPVSTSRVLYERSFLRNALMFARRAWIAPEKKHPATRFQGIASGSDVTFTFASEDHHRRVETAKLKKTAEAIREADALCHRAGAMLVVVFVPTKFRIYQDRCRFPADSPCRVWPLNNAAEALRKSITGIAVLDLTRPFQEAADRGELLYFPDDTHWTPTGHGLAARIISRLLMIDFPTTKPPTTHD